MKKLLILVLISGFALAGVSVKKCTGCHGQNFEKKALGKSAVVKDITKEEIVKDLKGYRDGTLNKHGMGMLMKGQVANMSDQDIENLVNQIK